MKTSKKMLSTLVLGGILLCGSDGNTSSRLNPGLDWVPVKTEGADLAWTLKSHADTLLFFSEVTSDSSKGMRVIDLKKLMPASESVRKKIYDEAGLSDWKVNERRIVPQWDKGFAFWEWRGTYVDTKGTHQAFFERQYFGDGYERHVTVVWSPAKHNLDIAKAQDLLESFTPGAKQ